MLYGIYAASHTIYYFRSFNIYTDQDKNNETLWRYKLILLVHPLLTRGQINEKITVVKITKWKYKKSLIK